MCSVGSSFDWYGGNKAIGGRKRLAAVAVAVGSIGGRGIAAIRVGSRSIAVTGIRSSSVAVAGIRSSGVAVPGSVGGIGSQTVAVGAIRSLSLSSRLSIRTMFRNAAGR